MLITGAGPVAQRRIRALSESGAAVTVVAREVGGQAEGTVSEAFGKRIRKSVQDGLQGIQRTLSACREGRPAGRDWFLVLAATGDPEADRLAALDGRRAGAFVNVAGKRKCRISISRSGKAGTGCGRRYGRRNRSPSGKTNDRGRAEVPGAGNDRRRDRKMIKTEPFGLEAGESVLAVIQSELIIEEIKRVCPGVSAQLVTMKTTGDMILDKSLEQIGGKGFCKGAGSCAPGWPV